MSVIYMKHPVHGTKVATMEAEARADETRGWSRFDPKVIAPTPPVAQVAPVVAAEAPRRGRPKKAVNGDRT